jgi:hypothetical protein
MSLTKKQKQQPLLTIPDDMWYEIVPFLKQEDWNSLLRMSKHHHSIFMDDTIIKLVVWRLNVYGNNMNLTTLTKWASRIPQSVLENMKCFEMSGLNRFRTSMLRNDLAEFYTSYLLNVETLVFYNSAFQLPVTLPKLKTLKLTNTTFDDIGSNYGVEFPALQHIYVDFLTFFGGTDGYLSSSIHTFLMEYGITKMDVLPTITFFCENGRIPLESKYSLPDIYTIHETYQIPIRVDSVYFIYNSKPDTFKISPKVTIFNGIVIEKHIKKLEEIKGYLNLIQ